MKKINKYILPALLLLTVGCKKSFFDINNNPNAAVTATPDLVLPAALTTTVSSQITGYAFINEWMGYWANAGNYALNASDYTTYRQTTSFGDNKFFTSYFNLSDYDFIEQAGISAKKPFFEATGKIMKAYVFQQLVDMFGNIPYSEAFKGTTRIQPKYDDAKTIYESLSLKLDTAVTLLKRNDAIGSSSSDVMFGGNNAKWIKFANTLKLRILIRQTEMPGRSNYITTEINKIIANGGGFLDNDAIVNPGYNTAQPNPFWQLNYNTSGTLINDFFRANQYTITFCKNNNDPRYTFLYAPAKSDQSYTGNVMGSPTNHTTGNSSGFGKGVLKSASQGALLFTASESYFLQSEAALRGYTSDDPAVLFKKGVQASFDYLGAGDATPYYTQVGNTNTTYEAATTFAAKLAVIIRQKWMAENMTTPFESWADYRRLNLPADIPLSASPYVDVLAIPFRILYPISEYATNAANVNAQGTIDHHKTKIFWMP